MANFFKKFQKKSESLVYNEQIVKNNLVSQLSENTKEVQYEFHESKLDCIELVDCTNSLCTTLEAIFLHGLKNSFFKQTIKAVSSDSNDIINERPNPNFWPLILIFLHAHTIEQIESLSQINTEIGNCRCWIRLSLNEMILSSYINAISKNSSALSPYYTKYALVKDAEMMDIIAKLLENLENQEIKFNLPINSSLLNQWPNMSLQLSGLWTPSIITCPIVNGLDVASTLTDNVTIPQPLKTYEFFPESISNLPAAPEPIDDINDNEHFQLFLKKIDEIAIEPDKNSENENNMPSSLPVNDVTSTITKPSGNALSLSSWSEVETSKDETSIKIKKLDSRSNSLTTSVSSLKMPTNRYSYDTLLIKYEKNRRIQPAFDDIWHNFESTLRDQNKSVDTSQPDDNNSEENLDFEVTTSDMFISQPLTMPELREMIECLCKLPREYGLDSQGFVCKACSHPLGIGFANAEVCAFSGDYFCESCMAQEQFILPAKIIYNSDFHRYNVSKKAERFLKDYQHQPFIDLKLLNPELYNVSQEMANIQTLRIKLNFIRAYLYTCCESIINELHNYVDYKKYLYEHIHKYSINDLIQLGNLQQLLQKAIQFGQQHILYDCNLCRYKGFICEKCNSPKVLYPFHVETTFQCPVCYAVFHDNCLNDCQPCPKCERKQKMEDLPLMDVVHML